MNTTIENLQRPTDRCDAVAGAIAKEIAPKVKQWLKDEDPSLATVESDMVKAMKCNYYDGYGIAKCLDCNDGYSPDAELVAILHGCSNAKSKEHDKLCREWVTATGIKELPLQARVTWPLKPELDVGVVTKNHPEGRSTVSFAALGRDRLIDWEQLDVKPRSAQELDCDVASLPAVTGSAMGPCPGCGCIQANGYLGGWFGWICGSHSRTHSGNKIRFNQSNACASMHWRLRAEKAEATLREKTSG